MAKMPRGSLLIYNPSSAAPGFKIKNIFCLPGVPSILKSMIGNCNKYLIKGSKTESKSINLHTVESNIANELSKIQKKFINYVEIGSYPFFRLGSVGVSIVLRSKNKTQITNCLKALKNKEELKKNQLNKISSQLHVNNKLTERVDSFIPMYVRNEKEYIKTLKSCSQPENKTIKIIIY